jgi:hypothetical protein
MSIPNSAGAMPGIGSKWLDPRARKQRMFASVIGGPSQRAIRGMRKPTLYCKFCKPERECRNG